MGAGDQGCGGGFFVFEGEDHEADATSEACQQCLAQRGIGHRVGDACLDEDSVPECCVVLNDVFRSRVFGQLILWSWRGCLLGGFGLGSRLGLSGFFGIVAGLCSTGSLRAFRFPGEDVLARGSVALPRACHAFSCLLFQVGWLAQISVLYWRSRTVRGIPLRLVLSGFYSTCAHSVPQHGDGVRNLGRSLFLPSYD